MQRRAAVDADPVNPEYVVHTLNDLLPASRGRHTLALRVLQKYGIPAADMTSCVETVDPKVRFVILHYSAQTNAAVARCVRQQLSPFLSGQSRRTAQDRHDD